MTNYKGTSTTQDINDLAIISADLQLALATNSAIPPNLFLFGVPFYGRYATSSPSSSVSFEVF
jgi:hypothetical protein